MKKKRGGFGGFGRSRGGGFGGFGGFFFQNSDSEQDDSSEDEFYGTGFFGAGRRAAPARATNVLLNKENVRAFQWTFPSLATVAEIADGAENTRPGFPALALEFSKPAECLKSPKQTELKTTFESVKTPFVKDLKKVVVEFGSADLREKFVKALDKARSGAKKIKEEKKVCYGGCCPRQFELVSGFVEGSVLGGRYTLRYLGEKIIRRPLKLASTGTAPFAEQSHKTQQI